MIINKGQVFKLKEQKVILVNEMYTSNREIGLFILNMWDPCDVEDINVLPVDFVCCKDEKQVYELKKSNVIIGGISDICLI